MSLSSSQMSGSRSAPRDPQYVSGRRPASVFHDSRQYRLAENSDDDGTPVPRRQGMLAGKNRNSRSKAIHRSFVSTPAEARASARAQLDDIVSGNDDSDGNLRERLHKELDADRIARLRDMNKQRLEALENKLLELHRQKQEIDGQSDGEARPSYFRHTKAYKPKAYAESQSQTSDDGVTTDDDNKGSKGPSEKREVVDHEVISGEESEGPAGYASDPGARKKEGGMDGAKSNARVHISVSHQSLRDMNFKRAPLQRKRRETEKVPFSFDSRVPKKSTRQLKFEQEMEEKQEREHALQHWQYEARPVPKTTREPLFEKNQQKQKERSEKLRRERQEALESSERPFKFWVQETVKEQTELRQLKHKINDMKEDLTSYGLSERAINKFAKQAWEVTKTDFTEAEQEQRRQLLRKDKAKKGKDQDMLTAPERKRLEELNLEHKKKSESKAFNLELHRRLAEELAKQKAKFRSVPVPKFPSEDIEREEADRRYKREQRANRLLSISSLPPRMQKHEEEFGNKIPPTADEVRQMRKLRSGDTPDPKLHTFKPKAPLNVPDFKREHTVLKLKLAERKLRMMEERKRGEVQPFYLRSEWNPFKSLKRWEDKYRSKKISEQVPEFKLKRLGLAHGDSRCTQWQLVEALARLNASSSGGAQEDVEESAMGLMTAEIREYCITPPSHFAIGSAIEEDIENFRDFRWPHSKEGRKEVQKAPTPKNTRSASSANPGTTKSLMHKIQHTAKYLEEQEQRKREEAEAAAKRRREREEFWGIKDKVRNELARDIEKNRQKEEERQKSMREARREFRNRTAEYEMKLKEKIECIKNKGETLEGKPTPLLMRRDISKRIKDKASEVFRSVLKAKGIEHLADELELEQMNKKHKQ